MADNFEGSTSTRPVVASCCQEQFSHQVCEATGSRRCRLHRRRGKAGTESRQGVPVPSASQDPDEVMAAARMRVEAALLGESDEMFQVLQEALKKAQAQAQERPVSERIHATKLFLERKQKRVESTAEQPRRNWQHVSRLRRNKRHCWQMASNGWCSFSMRRRTTSPFRSPPNSASCHGRQGRVDADSDRLCNASNPVAVSEHQ